MLYENILQIFLPLGILKLKLNFNTKLLKTKDLT
jgi:hypothetical protein